MITDMKAHANSQNLEVTAMSLQKELLAIAEDEDDHGELVLMLSGIVKNDPKLEMVETFKKLIKAFTT
jgi:hypothetical protein